MERTGNDCHSPPGDDFPGPGEILSREEFPSRLFWSYPFFYWRRIDQTLLGVQRLRMILRVEVVCAAFPEVNCSAVTTKSPTKNAPDSWRNCGRLRLRGGNLGTFVSFLRQPALRLLFCCNGCSSLGDRYSDPGGELLDISSFARENLGQLLRYYTVIR